MGTSGVPPRAQALPHVSFIPAHLDTTAEHPLTQKKTQRFRGPLPGPSSCWSQEGAWGMVSTSVSPPSCRAGSCRSIRCSCSPMITVLHRRPLAALAVLRRAVPKQIRALSPGMFFRLRGCHLEQGSREGEKEGRLNLDISSQPLPLWEAAWLPVATEPLPSSPGQRKTTHLTLFFRVEPISCWVTLHTFLFLSGLRGS